MSHHPRSTCTSDTLSTSTRIYTTLHDQGDQISEDNTPPHEIQLQDDCSIEIDLTSTFDDHGKQSEQPNISSMQVFPDSYDYEMFLLSLELDTSLNHYSDSHDSPILDQEGPLFTQATSLGRFFTLH